MQDLHQTINNYEAAWQETDASKRHDLLTFCFTENGRYVDPTAEVNGRAELSDHIGKVLKNSDGRVEITSKSTNHHDVIHFTWHMVGPDGTIFVAGHDFGLLDASGKITHLAGFFGDPAPLD